MEKSIEKKLDLLLNLQTIDKQIDEIIYMRGGLPQEVKELEEEIANFQETEQTYQENLNDLEESIKAWRSKIKECESLVLRYEDQQMNVRNNREYDAITKEIELQRLDIQLSEKKIKNAYEEIDKKKAALEELGSLLKNKEISLDEKQKELKAVIADSEENEKGLHKKREKVIKAIDQDLVETYEKIRKNARNNLAVILVKSGACMGCFTMVYPQLQAEIKEKNQIINCEHCGRIIAGVIDPLIIQETSEG
jgi:predicted  nucleic acid-binding Zn-ribbon protein